MLASLLATGLKTLAPLRIYLLGGLICLNLITGVGWHLSHKALVAEKAAHQLDNSLFKQAQKLADKNAQAEKDRLIKEAHANAAQADAKYSTLLSSYHTNLLRYRANQSDAHQTEYHQLPTPQGGDGPSAGAQLPSTSIVISIDDAQVCAVNTARLMAVHDWAVTLPKETK